MINYFLYYIAKSTKPSLRQQRKPKQNKNKRTANLQIQEEIIIIEQNNTEVSHEMHNIEIIQNQRDNINIADKAAFAALAKAASDTAVLQSSDGIKNFALIVTLSHIINILFL